VRMAATIEERVAALERALRRWRFVAIAALVLAAASMSMLISGQPALRRVRAQELVVLNASGEPVATLANEAAGPLLRMHARGLRQDLVLGSLGGGNTGLALYNAEQPRVILGLGKNGAFPALSISDSNGRTRLLAGLDTGERQSPVLQMRDEHDRVRIYADVEGEPRLLVSAQAGGPLLPISATCCEKRPRQNPPR
jgi:hypothetical protein